MKRRKKTWLLLSASIVMLSCSMFKFGTSTDIGAKTVRAQTTDGTGYEKYVGYGYNPANGIPLIDTGNAFHFSDPILDVNNPEMWANVDIKTDIDSTRQDSMNFSSSSVTETAEKIGNSISGGISGKVKTTTVNINSTFGITRNTHNIAQEIFTYYSMVIRRRTVAIQANEIKLRKYLNPSFLADAKKIDSREEASNFLDKYGAYLLGGYTLGGLLETTNYFASISSSVHQSSSFNLQSQISTAIGLVEAGSTVDFTNTYGQEYDSVNTTNVYHFTSYGGEQIPNLSIDHLFAIKGGELSENKNFVYSSWTDSINRNENLAIIEVPRGSRMIGVWELLPETDEYNNAKPYLLEAYISQCSNAVIDSSYSDLVRKISIPELEKPTFTMNGYEIYSDLSGNNTNVLSRYYSRKNSDSSTITVQPGDILAFDFNSNEYSGSKIVWSKRSSSIIPNDTVTILDDRNGIFKFSENIDDDIEGLELMVRDNNNDLVTNPIKVKVSVTRDFSGGSGTEEDPYIISTNDDLLTLMQNITTDSGAHKDYYAQHYRLINDLDFANVTDANSIGNSVYPFTGSFDGANHTISNLTLTRTKIFAFGENYGGLFGIVDGGKISNLILNNPKLDTSSGLLIDTSITKLVGFGCIAGYSKSGSTIENCQVKNPGITISLLNYGYSLTKPIVNDGKEIFVGGAVGQNEGIIDHVSVLNGSISVSGEEFRTLAVGGLVGVNGSKDKNTVAGLISNINVKNVTLTASAGVKNASTTRQPFVGGLIGIALDVNVNRVNLYFANALLTANALNSNQLATVGGAVGYIYGDYTNDKCVLSDVVITGGKGFLQTSTDGDKSHIGFLAGDGNETEKITFKNIKADTSKGDIWKAFGHTTTNIPDGYLASPSGVILLSISEYSEDHNIEIDTSNAKLYFNIGESFSTGDIKVTSDGQEVYSYWLDYSNFNSSFAGYYEIFVKFGGETVSYYVRVKSSNVSSILVSLKNENATYYKDELLTVDDFKFVQVLDNGDEVELNIDNDNVVVIMNHNGNGKLSEGSNQFNFVVTIDSYEYSCETVVNVQGRAFKSIAWLNGTPEWNAYTNSASSASQLKGSSFEVQYDKGGKAVYTFVTDNTVEEKTYRADNVTACEARTYSKDELNIDVILPSISLGNNVGTLCYEDYRTLSFVVNGVIDETDHSLELRQIQTLLDNIGNSTNMIQRYGAIKAAKNYINNLTWYSDELGEYSRELQVYIDSYNSTVEEVNADLIEATEINVGMNGFALEDNTPSIILVIIGIVLAI